MPESENDIPSAAASQRQTLDLLNTVAVKVPAFWPDCAEAWFHQTEAQFALKGVSVSTTKFYYCISAFNRETAVQVLDLIRSPPADPYEALKARLLQLYGLDDFQRYEAICSLPLSGDIKPSKLMTNMLALLPEDHKPCFFLRGAFLKRLPADVRAHLVRDSISDPVALALKADEIYQSRTSSQPVFAVSDHTFPEDLPVNAVRSSSNRPRRSVTPHASARSSTRSDSPSLCWYHRNHGSNAQKCKPPCSWSGN